MPDQHRAARTTKLVTGRASRADLRLDGDELRRLRRRCDRRVRRAAAGRRLRILLAAALYASLLALLSAMLAERAARAPDAVPVLLRDAPCARIVERFGGELGLERRLRNLGASRPDCFRHEV